LVLSRIRLENFRCIRVANLDLAPLTILYGENGAGKSSIIEGLQLLKQSAGQRVNLTGIDIHDPLQRITGQPRITGLDFGEYYDVVRNNVERNWITLEIEIRPTRSELDELNKIITRIRSLSASTLPRNLLGTVDRLGLSVSFRKQEIKQSVLVNSEVLETVEYVRVGPTSYISRITSPEALIDKPRPRQGDEFLMPEIFRTLSGHEEIDAIGGLSAGIVQVFHERLQNIYLLSASRGDIPRRGVGRKRPDWVGIKGEQIIELLSLIFSISRSEYGEIAKKVKFWAEKFQIKELYAGWIGEEGLKASFRDPKLPEARPNLADAGRGSRQVLSIITQIFFSERGSTILIEEPEASLHFGLLIDLMELFGEAIKENKQIIVTTHSPSIPSVLKSCIKSKILKAKDVAIYELNKAKDGSTAKRLPITKEGIVKGFIPSIAKAEKKLLDKY
jgi:ABC-type cobalamin/Fe3+-siderophores transport system ATPase subunit